MAGFAWPVRVYYEDTDAGGVVYHANYLRFFERARTEWLRARGLEQDRLMKEFGILFAVREMNLGFVKSARFNQRLAVEVDVTEANRLVVWFAQRIVLLEENNLPGSEILLCTAQVKVVTLEAGSLRPKRMPDSIFAEISREHRC